MMKRIAKFGCLGILVVVVLVAILIAFTPQSTPQEASAQPDLAILIPTVTPTALSMLLPPTATPLSTAIPWYSGGTLHGATLAEWRAGSPDDKLATAADWYVAARGLTNLQADDEPALRNLAIMMVACVDEVARPEEGYDTDSMAAAEMGLACATIIADSSDYGPMAATLED